MLIYFCLYSLYTGSIRPASYIFVLAIEHKIQIIIIILLPV